jgi:hypothetical protein
VKRTADAERVKEDIRMKEGKEEMKEEEKEKERQEKKTK